jgi:hypothetical protein
MTWNLNASDYTDDELLELFGMLRTDSNEKKSQKMADSISKVRRDDRKSQSEIASFVNFAEDIAERLGFGILDGGYHNQGDMDEYSAAAKTFSSRQPVTEVDGHMLISNKSRTEGHTHRQYGREGNESRAPPGQLNPLKVHTVNKAVNIDSRFRDNYYNTKSTDFTVTLPTRITECTQIQVGNLTIPLTAYCFSAENGNTTFVVTITTAPATVNRYVITIPDGNYSTPFGGNPGLTSMQDIINAKMTEAGINTTTELSYNVDSVTGKSVFSTPATTLVTGFTLEFACGTDGVILTDDNIQMRLGWSLGFRDGTYSSSPASPASPPYSVISEGICLPVCPRYMFLVVDEFQQGAILNYFNAGYQSSLLPNNILTRIDIGSLNGNQGYYTLGDAQGSTTSMNSTRSYFGPITIERLRISLYDEFGRIVNLNNMDWSVSLAMTCVYEQT